MQLRFEVLVPADRGAVFAFHETPAHLAVLMRGRRGFRLLRHDGNILPGSMTWIQETIGAVVPVTMGFRHVLFEPPGRFAEEMVHGPFRRFVHLHEFEQANGETKVVDVVDVALPRHYGGDLATRRLVVPMIRRRFVDRHAALMRAFARSASTVEERSGSTASC